MLSEEFKAPYYLKLIQGEQSRDVSLYFLFFESKCGMRLWGEMQIKKTL